MQEKESDVLHENDLHKANAKSKGHWSMQSLLVITSQSLLLDVKGKKLSCPRKGISYLVRSSRTHAFDLLIPRKVLNF